MDWTEKSADAEQAAVPWCCTTVGLYVVLIVPCDSLSGSSAAPPLVHGLVVSDASKGQTESAS